ncbi:hypothetical protein ERW51_04570 [Aliivibrio finisterrensis]|uniref:hypothetical protein n=1 Tax=Aliivibrio finisterrensis TaxID=511998 RepID=UPI00101FC777|nr:hypothetical protein [Aliivibrio finisterrensis]RYU69975.1 hypothetical protein ERW54_04575 [Aliivibrio finisterrensis]RYU73764.1 hypothetical protein ERW51_04570 [Aliivibrio finisterrensis]RYU76607.1 hypothetical protein ERW48_04585 [Aliivibrio finisterrensis]
MSKKTDNGIWFAYIASLLTPITLMISGIIAIIYAGYQMNKGTNDEVIDSHYYAIIKSFFLFLTFFVVLAVTAATISGMAAGLDYWVDSSVLDKVYAAIPIVGAVISVLAIGTWFVKLAKGMQKLKAYQPIENQ